jgi:hypothetical protein
MAKGHKRLVVFLLVSWHTFHVHPAGDDSSTSSSQAAVVMTYWTILSAHNDAGTSAPRHAFNVEPVHGTPVPVTTTDMLGTDGFEVCRSQWGLFIKFAFLSP